MECCESPEAQNSLEAILTHSVFRDEGELKAQLQAMKESGKKTKIIISNLKRLKDGKFELHFPHDEKDICCPETGMSSEEQSTPKYKHSLREYCSILYLKPSMRIIIRGEKVQTKLISKSLSHSVEDKFKPNWLKDPVKITIGFACEKGRGQDYGLMLYHKNRLIKAYERVGYQKQAGNRGIGVVGVAAVDFLQPIHNKQDFMMDEKYYSVIRAFGLKLNDYWNEMMNCDSPSSSQSSSDLPDWTWANCDKCLKWRRLPDSVNPETLPAKWYCWNNHDTKH
ncbi:MORC family CW-type Zinc finger protein 3, partial [Plakobranchus ocellatus]